MLGGPCEDTGYRRFVKEQNDRNHTSSADLYMLEHLNKIRYAAPHKHGAIFKVLQENCWQSEANPT